MSASSWGGLMSKVAASGSLATRAVLAVLLLVGFYLLALAIVGGLLYLAYFSVFVGGRIPVKLVLVAVVSAGTILWAILPRIDRFQAPGPALKEGDQPRLFGLLKRIARATGQA